MGGMSDTRAVRIGLQLQPQHADYSDIRRTVAAAEDAGVDVIFNWDHFFPLYGEPDGKHFECWTMLGAWAEATSRVEIGALVTCNSYRDRWTRINPAPTRDIPVLIGGGGEKKTLRYTAEHATIWHGFGDVGTVVHKCSVLDAHCRDIGRDPAGIERSAGVEGAPEDLGPGLYDSGVRMFTVGQDGQDGYDLGRLTEWIAWRDERNAG